MWSNVKDLCLGSYMYDDDALLVVNDTITVLSATICSISHKLQGYMDYSPNSSGSFARECCISEVFTKVAVTDLSAWTNYRSWYSKRLYCTRCHDLPNL